MADSYIDLLKNEIRRREAEHNADVRERDAARQVIADIRQVLDAANVPTLGGDDELEQVARVKWLAKGRETKEGQARNERKPNRPTRKWLKDELKYERGNVRGLEARLATESRNASELLKLVDRDLDSQMVLVDRTLTEIGISFDIPLEERLATLKKYGLNTGDLQAQVTQLEAERDQLKHDAERIQAIVDRAHPVAFELEADVTTVEKVEWFVDFWEREAWISAHGLSHKE